MRKKVKVGLIVTIIAIGLISAGVTVLYLFILPPRPKGPEANTYIKDSSINFLYYAVKFTDGNISLENSLNISHGLLNGYSVINSTICENSTINNEASLVSISLHNDVNLTIRNIYYPSLSLYLHDDSSIVVQNCTFYNIRLFDDSSATIKNSSIESILVTPFDELYIGWVLFHTSISIENSVINYIKITEKCRLSIKNSTMLGLGAWSIEIKTIHSGNSKVTGYIENCTLDRVRIEGYVGMKFLKSNLSDLFVFDTATAILNQSIITDNFGYGIIAHESNPTEPIYINRNGTVSGDQHMPIYKNNTQMIDSSGPIPSLVSVAGVSFGQIVINNYSCSVFLNDFSSAIIANVTAPLHSFYGILMQYSSLTLENCELTQGQLAVIFEGTLTMRNTSLSTLYCNTFNSITIDDCIIESIWTYFLYLPKILSVIYLPGNIIDNLYISNSTIMNLHTGGKDIVHVEDSTIFWLYEGIFIYSGSLMLNTGGFSGTGNYLNSTTLVNTTVSIQRYLSYIEINGSAQLTVQDYSNPLDILCLDNVNLICKKSSFDNIVCYDLATVTMENCIVNELIYLEDDSSLYVYQNSVVTSIFATKNNFISITYSFITGNIMICETSRAVARNSLFGEIVIYGSNYYDYAFKGYNSIVGYLYTFTWSF